MKTFEEKYTAWVDQRLPEEERATFEKELADLARAEHDRADAQRLGSLLRTHASAPGLTNPDFFNHQIRHRIQVAKSAPGASPQTWWHWSVPRLITAAAMALLTAFVLFKTI